MSGLSLEETIRIHRNINRFMIPEHLAELLSSMTLFTFPRNAQINNLAQRTINRREQPQSLSLKEYAHIILSIDYDEDVAYQQRENPNFLQLLSNYWEKLRGTKQIDTKTFQGINDYIEWANLTFGIEIREIRNMHPGKIIKKFESYLDDYKKNRIEKGQFWGFVWATLVHDNPHINGLVLMLRNEDDLRTYKHGFSISEHNRYAQPYLRSIKNDYDGRVDLERRSQRLIENLKEAKRKLEGVLKQLDQERKRGKEYLSVYSAAREELDKVRLEILHLAMANLDLKDDLQRKEKELRDGLQTSRNYQELLLKREEEVKGLIYRIEFLEYEKEKFKKPSDYNIEWISGKRVMLVTQNNHQSVKPIEEELKTGLLHIDIKTDPNKAYQRLNDFDLILGYKIQDRIVIEAMRQFLDRRFIYGENLTELFFNLAKTSQRQNTKL